MYPVIFGSVDIAQLRQSWTVLCDFDGTIVPEDVTDALLLRFARPGWERLEDDWRAGRIGSRQCMAGQVALLDCSRAELDAHLAAVEIDPRFAAFADAVLRAGSALRVVSDGLDYAINAILARYGLMHLPVRAAHLVQDGPRAWRLDFPFARAEHCAGATCKCAQAGGPRPGALQPRTLMIGDGASDVCVAGRCDLVFAKSTLLAHCRAHAIPHRPITNFADALDVWHQLTALPPRTLGVMREPTEIET